MGVKTHGSGLTLQHRHLSPFLLIRGAAPAGWHNAEITCSSLSPVATLEIAISPRRLETGQNLSHGDRQAG